PPRTQISTLSLHDALPISATQRDLAGDLLENWGAELQELEPIEVKLEPSAQAGAGHVEQVALEARVTETGTLRLAAISQRSGQRDRKSTRLNSSHVKISYA